MDGQKHLIIEFWMLIFEGLKDTSLLVAIGPIYYSCVRTTKKLLYVGALSFFLFIESK